MALQNSGAISLSQIRTEAYLGQTTVPTTISLNDTKVRSLGKVPTTNTLIKFSDFYGKSKYTFQNGDFSSGSLTLTTGNAYELPGWISYASSVRLNGLSTVVGKPTPADDKADEVASSGSYTVSLSNDLPPGMASPSRSLWLYNTGVVSSYGIAHGPYAVSQDPISLETGDVVSFWWKAQGGNDAYDINAYLVNVNTGSYISLLNGTGANASATVPWTKVTVTITAGQASSNPDVPDYKFVFISGSYDATGGTVTGASLYVTMIEIKKWFQP